MFENFFQCGQNIILSREKLTIAKSSFIPFTQNSSNSIKNQKKVREITKLYATHTREIGTM